jgi:hypothetical protein
MMGIIIVVNKFSISVASWEYFQRQLAMQMRYAKFMIVLKLFALRVIVANS